jgi:hypothetical protein
MDDLEIGLCANWRGSWPSDEEIRELKPQFLRSIVYDSLEVGDMLASCKRNGIGYVPLLNFPEWKQAREHGWQPALSQLLSAYRDIKCIELRNEWDLLGVSVDEIYRETRDAMLAIYQLDRDVKIVLGAVAGPQWQEACQELSARVREHPLAKTYVIAAAFHPYGQRPDDFDTELPIDWGFGDYDEQISRFVQLTGLKCALTETGIKLIDADSVSAKPGDSEEQQARYIETAIKSVRLLGKELVWKMSIFGYNDALGAPSERDAHAFGLKSANSVKRPAWRTYAEQQSSVQLPNAPIVKGPFAMPESLLLDIWYAVRDDITYMSNWGIPKCWRKDPYKYGPVIGREYRNPYDGYIYQAFAYGAIRWKGGMDEGEPVNV